MKKNLIKYLNLALSSLLFVSCITHKNVGSIFPEQIQSYQLPEGHGYIVGSIVNDKSTYVNHNFFMKEVKSTPADAEDLVYAHAFWAHEGANRVNKFNNGFFRYEFGTPEKFGFLYAMPVPAGTYSFAEYGGTTMGLNGSAGSEVTKYEVGTSFSVKPKQATYVGEYTFKGSIRGHNILGMALAGPTFVTGSNQFNRDKALLIKKYPFLKNVIILDTKTADQYNRDQLNKIRQLQ